MLHGIDISNWQKGMQVPERVDFCRPSRLD